MRRMLWLLSSLLLSCIAAHGQSARPSIPQEKPPGECELVDEYKEKAPPGYLDLQAATNAWWSIIQCEWWAEKHNSPETTRDAFHALNNLQMQLADEFATATNSLLSAAPKGAPAACETFWDYRTRGRTALEAAMKAGKPLEEERRIYSRALDDFEDQLVKQDYNEFKATSQNLTDCSSWALRTHWDVLARDVRVLDDSISFRRLLFESEKLLESYKEALTRYDELLALARRQAAALSLVGQPAILGPRFQPPPRLHCEERTEQIIGVEPTFITTIDCR